MFAAAALSQISSVVVVVCCDLVFISVAHFRFNLFSHCAANIFVVSFFFSPLLFGFMCVCMIGVERFLPCFFYYRGKNSLH